MADGSDEWQGQAGANEVAADERIAMDESPAALSEDGEAAAASEDTASVPPDAVVGGEGVPAPRRALLSLARSGKGVRARRRQVC